MGALSSLLKKKFSSSNNSLNKLISFLKITCISSAVLPKCTWSPNPENKGTINPKLGYQVLILLGVLLLCLLFLLEPEITKLQKNPTFKRQLYGGLITKWNTTSFTPPPRILYFSLTASKETLLSIYSMLLSIWATRLHSIENAVESYWLSMKPSPHGLVTPFPKTYWHLLI